MNASQIPDSTRMAVLHVVEQLPYGASIRQIEARLTSPPHRRTLQRWLLGLIAEGQIRRQGNGRALRYFASSTSTGATILKEPPAASFNASGRSTATIHSEAAIPLSQEARQIEATIRQPLERRKPVGYNRSFLDSYRPNETYYLPESVRNELVEHGKSNRGDEPAGTYARRLANRLLIDLSWNSSRLEGNTYSLLETERLLSAGEPANDKNAFEAQMILNHKEAIEFLVSCADDIAFNRYTVLNLHALLADNLLPDPAASGRLRSIPVGIGLTTFLPLADPPLIEECFDQVLNTAKAIRDPFEQAFFVMVHLPYLQPFEDVNKRVSRLTANIPLIKGNLCPLSFVDMPQSIYLSAMLGVYELNRVELLRDVFIWAYKRSCARYSAVRQSLGEPDPLRLKYRDQIIQIVGDVVHKEMNKAEAIAFVRRQAQERVESTDLDHFIEVVETQLLNLHEGNIARYRLRPAEYRAWQSHWA